MSELSWAAGFYDGEGCLTQCRGAPRVIVSQRNRQVLERFAGIVGEGKIGDYLKENRPYYQFYAHGFAAIRVIAQLWPALSEVKQIQARRILSQKVRPKFVMELP